MCLGSVSISLVTAHGPCCFLAACTLIGTYAHTINLSSFCERLNSLTGKHFLVFASICVCMFVCVCVLQRPGRRRNLITLLVSNRLRLHCGFSPLRKTDRNIAHSPCCCSKLSCCLFCGLSPTSFFLQFPESIQSRDSFGKKAEIRPSNRCCHSLSLGPDEPKVEWVRTVQWAIHNLIKKITSLCFMKFSSKHSRWKQILKSTGSFLPQIKPKLSTSDKSDSSQLFNFTSAFFPSIFT